MSDPNVDAIKAALLAPIQAFLTQLQQPGVNVLSVTNAFGGLQLAEMQVLPSVQSSAIAAVAHSIQSTMATKGLASMPAPLGTLPPAPPVESSLIFAAKPAVK